jgi:peptide deformylase
MDGAKADRVLPLGDPRLRLACEAVGDLADPAFRAEAARLKVALDAFRAERGFGRGIAAPQIGIARRLVAINLGEGTRCLVNPAIEWRSPESFTMWDDCMCFPELLVRLRRSDSITVSFQDEEGSPRRWERLGRAASELLQHELDHLDGVLAVDLALDSRGIVYRAAFDADPGYFKAQVDYAIGDI